MLFHKFLILEKEFLVMETSLKRALAGIVSALI